MAPSRHKIHVSLQQKVSPLHRLIKELSDLKFALELSAIVAITKHTGEIVYVNDKFCEITKFSRKEVIGQTHRIINSGYHPPSFFRDLWDTILAGKIWQGEIRDRAKDGCIFWVDTTIVPLLDEGKRPYQFVCIRNEISRRKEMEEALKSLPRRIIQAQEEERERISREIHDDLGQSLATLKILIQANILRICQRHDCAARPALAQVIEYLDSIIEKTRALAAGLRPSSIEVFGLAASIRALVNDLRKGKAAKIYTHIGRLDHLHFPGDPINLYRIIQEALTNSLTHAQATRIFLDIRRRKDLLVVTIRDNGKGFDLAPQRTSAKIPGLGLSTMQERAKLLQGELFIDSVGGEGTVVRLTVPVRERGHKP